MKYLKNLSKRLKEMGQGASHPGSSKGRPFSSRKKQSGATPPTNYDLPPLRFHLTHGENISLSPSKEEAIRSESFCKGIVFRLVTFYRNLFHILGLTNISLKGHRNYDFL